jgi:predicted O-methyltransferase YrrM
MRQRLRTFFSSNTQASAALDIGLLAPVALAGLVMRAARKLGLPERMPRSTAALDRIGVYPVLHHYYEPLVTSADLRRPLSEVRALPGLDLNETGQLALMDELTYAAELLALPDGPMPDAVFTFANRMFGPGDAELLYSIIRLNRPRRIVEIGSGESSLIAELAIAANIADEATYRCEHWCVEPFENSWLEQRVSNVVRSRVEHLDVELFDDLDAGDILFIDSTHVIRPQGDVLFEFLEIIGRLRHGVYVHVHDIFTPRDYPHRWVVAERKTWNEQYLLEALLCHTDRFEVVAALNHLWHEHPEVVGRALPVLSRHPDAEPGSFWFRVR